MKITDQSHISILTPEQAWHYRIFPKEKSNDQLVFYCDSDQYEANKRQEIELLLDMDIAFETISTEDLNKLLSKHYLRQDESRGIQKSASFTIGENLLEGIIEEAHHLASSDIHIECYKENARIRYRIDGLLIERHFLNKTEYPTLINRIKIMANLDIAEKRLPQDGRIFFSSGKDKFDIRVSILPALHGEKIVLRLLKTNLTFIDFDRLGFDEMDKQRYLEGIKRPNGIVLISGPTGSGKTTTLYGTLKLLNSPSKNILTIEDPIEYTLDGINQVQLKENIGLTFSTALRTFLRQDPDIIMLGEIRDPETAAIAIRASLTGHLVLSTIHTNSAWGIVSRLKNMNIPSYLIADTLNLAVAQRLLRLLCEDCKLPSTLMDHENLLIERFIGNENKFDTYKACGCDKCHFTGYKGRKAIYEVIYNNQDFTTAIKNEQTQVDEIKAKHHIHSLVNNAVSLFLDGTTSFEEIYPILIATQ